MGLSSTHRCVVTPFLGSIYQFRSPPAPPCSGAGGAGYYVVERAPPVFDRCSETRSGRVDEAGVGRMAHASTIEEQSMEQRVGPSPWGCWPVVGNSWGDLRGGSPEAGGLLHLETGWEWERRAKKVQDFQDCAVLASQDCLASFWKLLCIARRWPTCRV